MDIICKRRRARTGRHKNKENIAQGKKHTILNDGHKNKITLPNTKKGRAHPRDANRKLNLNNGRKTENPAKNSKVPNKEIKGIEHQGDLATKSMENQGYPAINEERTINKSI